MRSLAAPTAIAALLFSSSAFAQDDYKAPPPEPAGGDSYNPPPNQGGGNGGSTTGSARSRRGGGDSGGSPEILRASTRPMWLVGGVGPDFHGINLGKKAFKPGNARVALAVDFGYHFDGAGTGPAIGATVEQTFGKGFYTFNPGFKFWYDIQVTDMAIYVAPFGKAGYLLGASSGGSAHGFNLAVGAEGRVVLDDRWMLFARPIQIDTVIGDFFGETFHVNIFILVGGGATF